MRTGKTIFRSVLFIALAAIVIYGCEKSGNLPDGFKPDPMASSSILGAGSNYTFVNSFDGGGLLCSKDGSYNDQPLATEMELWMGVGNEKAGTLVGTVTFEPGKAIIKLTGDIFPYVITAAHIHFAATVDGIPHTRNGNPVPGQFEYNVPVDPGQSEITVPVEFEEFGAIHLSVVKYGGVEGFNYYLPNDPVTLRIVDYPTAGNPSYFKLKVTGGGFISDYNMGYGPGVYTGWCIDVDNTINLNVDYPAMLYSSYESLPSWMTGPGMIESPENFDKINYLINHFSAGTMVQPLNADCSTRTDPSTGLTVPEEALTYSDIQRAIWHYIDNNQSTSGLSTWSQYRVNAIVCAVEAGGENFVPGCNQKIVFLVIPTGNALNFQVVIGQPVIGEIQVPCETISRTAWGDGKFGAGFPGAKQWGTYFKYGCNP